MQYPNLITALITPFLSNGELDLEGFKFNIQYQLDCGIKGLLVLGTTGESPTLSNSEREVLIETAVRLAKGKAHIFVGAGTNDTRATLKQIQQAEILGADTALVIAPYYNLPMQEGIFQHFEAISNSCSLPICLYNHPGRTNVNVTHETFIKISHFPQIIGLKETASNLSQAAATMHYFRSIKRTFALWAGDDLSTLPLMSLGACGVISVMSNLMPKTMKAMVDSVQENDIFLAQKQLDQLYPILHILFNETNPIGIKAAMNLCGLPAGKPRLPLTPLSEFNLNLFKKALQKCDLNYALAQKSGI